MVYIVIGPAPELSGVMYPAHAPMPPARIIVKTLRRASKPYMETRFYARTVPVIPNRLAILPAVMAEKDYYDILGVKKAAIKYAITGKSRSAEIPGIMHMAVEPLGSMHSSGEIWATIGHPVAPASR